MLERTRRTSVAEDTMPSTVAGMTRLAMPCWPVTGNQPSWSEKTRIASSPSQKIGIDTPASATSMAKLSTQVLWRSAETMPRETPNTMLTTKAAAANSAVRGSRSASSNATGRPFCNDRPRSPWSARPMKSRYWT